MDTPKTAPITTSIGLWPWTSFTGKNFTPDFSSKFFPSSFNLFAWIPLERLTPKASLITTIIKQNAKIKISEFIPALKPIVVQREETKAVWLEGIPPVLHSKSSNNCFRECIFPKNKLITVFINWAENQLKIHDKKTGFVNNKCICILALESIFTFFPSIENLSRGLYNLLKNIIVYGMEFVNFETTNNDCNRRFDTLIRKFLPEMPLSLVYKNIRTWFIRLNDKKTKQETKIKLGDVINIEKRLYNNFSKQNKEINLSDEYEKNKKFIENITIFKNESILILDKPYNFNVQNSENDKNSLDTIIKSIYSW